MYYIVAGIITDDDRHIDADEPIEEFDNYDSAFEYFDNLSEEFVTKFVKDQFPIYSTDNCVYKKITDGGTAVLFLEEWRWFCNVEDKYKA